MIEIQRELWRSSCPTPPAHAGPPRAGSQDHIPMSFEHLQGWRLYRLPGQPVPVLVTLTVKEFFPYVQMEPPVFLQNCVLLENYTITNI